MNAVERAGIDAVIRFDHEQDTAQSGSGDKLRYQVLNLPHFPEVDFATRDFVIAEGEASGDDFRFQLGVPANAIPGIEHHVLLQRAQIGEFIHAAEIGPQLSPGFMAAHLNTLPALLPRLLRTKPSSQLSPRLSILSN